MELFLLITQRLHRLSFKIRPLHRRIWISKGAAARTSKYTFPVELAIAADDRLIADPGLEGLGLYLVCFMENSQYFGWFSADRTYKLFLLSCGSGHGS